MSKLRFFLFALCLAACLPIKSAEPPLRAQARAAVLNMAFALHVADEVCAEQVEHTDAPDAAQKLALKCIVAIENGRDALIIAEKILDSWKDGDEGALFCAAKKGVEALSSVNSVLNGVGVKTPVEIQDAIQVVQWVGVGCKS